MIVPQPINCHKCGAQVVSDARNLTNFVIQPPGLKCFCGEIVIPATGTMC